MVSLAAAREYIDQLDLNYIVDVMCASSYSLPQWTLPAARECMALYKRFLWLQKKHLSVPIVPTREIDEFWHNHILHTQQYFKDCEGIFGYYLHHRPASRSAGETELRQLAAAFLKTKQLYLAEFQTPLVNFRSTYERA